MAARTSKRKDSNPNAKIRSKKKRIIRRHTNIDLPDEILEHIFSFLPIKSLAQTILLSKHWNHLSLWRTHPHLIHLSPNPHQQLSRKLQSKAENFLPILLSRRQQDSDVTTFRLFGHVSSSRLRDYIDRVMNYRIEQLEIDVSLSLAFNSYCNFELPPSLFNCNTLRVLTLNHQNKNPVQNSYWLHSYFIYNTSAGLPSVHTLSLTGVHIGHGSDLFSGEEFPLLRKLCLRNCKGMSDLNINCPGLEILKLDGLRLEGLDVSCVGLLELRITKCFRHVDGWAKIIAPSLRSLYWESGVIVEITTESFRDLNTCSLYFHSQIVPDTAKLQSLSAFLFALCSVRSLSVGSRVLETLSKIDSEGGLPCSFNNLMTLELHTDMTQDDITGITCLLRRSPILHTITISVNSCSNPWGESCDETQCWRSLIQNLKSIELHLKVVRIDVQGTKMHKSAVYLVELLLNHGRALQELTLTLKSKPGVPPFQRQIIRSQIMKFARSSSNVIISVLPQDPPTRKAILS